MSRDQTIGAAIFIVCITISVFYITTLLLPTWPIATPVLIAFVAVMGIGAWIGWTMATTPPPKLIEEIKSEIEKKSEE